MAPRPAAQIRKEVLRLIGLTLGRQIRAQKNPSRSSEPAWDSLKHVELMFLIEDHFGVRFSEAEMARMEDAEQIVRVLEARDETKRGMRPAPEAQ